MSRKSWMVAISALAFSAAPLWAATGLAQITGTTDDSEITGVIHFEDTKAGLHVSGEIENAPVGDHGFHIHEFGDCGDEGKNAGGHFNPDNRMHGYLPKDGLMKSHAGDLGNIKVDVEGNGKINVTLPKLTLTGGKYPVAGRAVVVHEKKDDFGQPSGNAGGRIACGAIVLSGQ